MKPLTFRQAINIRYCGSHYTGKLVGLRYRRNRRTLDDLLGTVEFSTRGGKVTKRREFSVSPYGVAETELRAVLKAFLADKREKLKAEGEAILAARAAKEAKP